MAIEIPEFRARMQSVDRRHSLYYQGDVADRSYILRSGRVLISTDLGNDRVLADLVLAPSAIGLETYEGLSHFQSTARAFPSAFVQIMTADDLNFADTTIAKVFQQAEIEVRERLFRRFSAHTIGIEAGLANFLLEYSSLEESIDGVTQGVIGLVSGFTREGINKHVKIMQERGVIGSQKRGQYETLDRETLEYVRTHGYLPPRSLASRTNSLVLAQKHLG